MTETELNLFCDKLLSDFKKNKLGGFIVLVTDEGLATISVLPEWSVLTADKDEKKIKLSQITDESINMWLSRAEKTIYFLEAVTQNCLEGSNSFSKILKSLMVVLEKTATDILNLENKPTVH